MIGRSTCAITTSDHMQVSHSGTPNLNTLEILNHFWPISVSYKQAATKDMDFIFPVRTLPSLAYQACNYEGIDMHILATVLCIVGENFVEIWQLTGQNVLLWLGSIKPPHLQTAYRNRAEYFSVDSNIIGRSTCPITRPDLMRVSHSRTPKLNILEILIYFWPTSQACKQATT